MRVICGGTGRDLAAAISRAVTQGCRGLVSFGVAGGLAPELKPGACIVGSAVLAGPHRMPTDQQWSQRVLRTIPNAVHGMLLGVPAPVSDPADKRTLYLNTGAVAVDMESHIVANIAGAHGMPMVAIRVVTDSAMRAIPRAALAAMRPNGTIDVFAMLQSLIKRPRDLSLLLQSALDVRAARATLRHGRRLLGPSLGLPESRGAKDSLHERPVASGQRRTNVSASQFGAFVPATGALQNAK